MKATPKASFLDLPREIRDIIYDLIRNELKREGLNWLATVPHANEAEWKKIQEGGRTGDLHGGVARGLIPAEEPIAQLDRFSDCAIMRTCRQVHSEFASVLYACPIHFLAWRRHVNEIPISPIYAGLVRSVLAVDACGDWSEPKSEEAWLSILQVAHSCAKLFPNATVIRVGWFVYVSFLHYLDSIPPDYWDSTVVAMEEYARKAARNLGMRSLLPSHVELVQLKGLKGRFMRPPFEGRSVSTPASQVVEKLRTMEL